MRTSIVFYLNGQRHEVTDERAGLMLADYLRYDKALTGTKIVCAEGDCGACSVLRAIPGKPAAYSSFNSCIMTVAQLDGSSLITVEALGTEPTARGTSLELSPIQKSMQTCHGSQCGFCTPGFVVALAGAVDAKLSAGSRGENKLTAREAKNALTGNLCRCTGYQPIIDAAVDIDLGECVKLKSRFLDRAQAAELLKLRKTGVHIKKANFEFFAPTSLREAAKFIAGNADARVLASATDLGVFHNKRRVRLLKVVSLHLVSRLDEITVLKNGRIRVGARVTLTELRAAAKKREPELARFLDIFASPQIKNVATLAGNVANASPIADTPPFLLVAGAEVHAVGPRGLERAIPIEEFFVGYRKTALKAGELIAAISFRPTARGEKTALFKVSERKDLDISNVNAGFRLRLSPSKQGRIVSEIKIAYGGVAATPLRLLKTENILVGRPLSHALIETALVTLQKEISPIKDVRGSAAYRRVIAENLMRRFFETELA